MGSAEVGRKSGCILVGTDFSEASRQALVMGRALAQERDAALIVLHVIEGHGLQEMARVLEIPERVLRDKLGRERRAALTRALADVDEGAGVPVEPVIAWGRPFEQILRKASDAPAQLIVLGTAGHTADLEKALFGSTAEKVLRSAPCPVLCVPVE